MGRIILQIPQNINRTFQIESEERAAEILEQIERLEDTKELLSNFEKGIASGAIRLPTRNDRREAGDAVLGIWADREESGQEIARRIRDRNNGKIE